jgi:hypothetical protein
VESTSAQQVIPQFEEKVEVVIEPILQEWYSRYLNIIYNHANIDFPRFVINLIIEDDDTTWW